MKKTQLIALVLLGIAAVANGQDKNDWIKLHEPHVYNEMPYRLLRPLNLEPERRYPVIVSLHHGGCKGSDNLRQMKAELQFLTEEQQRKDYPCYIVAPQSEGGWNSTHLQNIKEIINDLPSVDMKKIYVFGHSMGGAGTYTFIQSDPDYFAAAATSAGSGLANRESAIDASLFKYLPIWAFHGDQDKVCPIDKDQKIFAKMQDIGGNMKFTTWKGDGHPVSLKMITGADNGATEFSSNLCDPEPVFLKWLFAKRRLLAWAKLDDWAKIHEPHRIKDMPYRLLRPSNFDPQKSYPVIVALHSGAGKGSDNYKQFEKWVRILTGEHNKNEDYNCYIVVPQSPVSWNPKHLQNVKDIISDLPSIDMNRIYVFGHSMGGSGTYTFVLSDPDYFAAAAASAGGGGDVDVSPLKDVPMWLFYGDQDKIERARTVFAKMKEIGGNMKFTTWVGDGHPVAPQMITGADNGMTQFSSDRCDPESVFLKWIFAQKLTKVQR
jgi:predicted peptidase